MKFGLFFSWQGASDNPALDHAIAQAKTAESLGYETVLIAEPPFERVNALFNAETILKSFSKATTNIRIGIADQVLAVQDPLKLAAYLAQTNDSLNGRLICGVAVGEDEEVYFHHGVPFEQCRDRFEEVLDILSLAWGDAPFDHVGRHYQCERQPPKPVGRSSGAPRMWFTARDLPTASSAAKRGFPMLPHWLSEHQVIIEQYQAFEEMVQRRDSDFFSFERPIVRDVFVAETTQAAEACALNPFRQQYLHHAQFCELLNYRNQPKMEAECTIDNLREHHLIVGDPDLVVKQLTELAEQTKTNHILCRMSVAGISQESALKSITLFANSVAPRLNA